METYKLNTQEREIVRGLNQCLAAAQAELKAAEQAFKVALATICAAHELDGNWSLSEKMDTLTQSKPKMHEATASGEMKLSAKEG